MLALRFFGGFCVASVLAIGCSAPAASGEDVAGSEGELHSATDCPKTIEVEVAKPTILSDAKLLSIYEKSWVEQGMADHAKEYAESDFDTAKKLIEQARGEKAVSLRGERQQACAYKTFDAKTGQQSDYSIWLSNDGKSLRVSQGSDTYYEQVFMQTDVKKVSLTELTLGPKDATVYAESTDNGHDGSDGWSYFAGYAKITAKVSE